MSTKSGIKMPELNKDIKEFSELQDCWKRNSYRLICCVGIAQEQDFLKTLTGWLQICDHIIICLTSYLEENHHHPVGI